MNILYLENHAVFVDQVTRQFLRAHHVTVVPSLAAARRALASGRFDLVLSDYDLDDGKGVEFVRECRNTHPWLPVIAVSSHDAGNAALVAAGASAVCSKMEFDRIQQVIGGLEQRVEKYLENIEAWCWRYKENTRNYPGLHFTAKPEACDAFLICLRQLRREGDGTHRTLSLRLLKLDNETKVSGGQEYECYSRLRITLHAESERIRQMSFRVEGGTVHFDFTERHLAEFEQGLSDIRSGTGDYSIVATEDRKQGLRTGELDRVSECLWFWPCFGHLRVVEDENRRKNRKRRS